MFFERLKTGAYALFLTAAILLCAPFAQGQETLARLETAQLKILFVGGEKLFTIAILPKDAEAIPAELRADVFAVESPSRLVVDIPGFQLDEESRVLLGGDYFSSIRLGKHPKKTRVVLDIKDGQAVSYEVAGDPEIKALFVDITFPNQPPEPPVPAPAPSPGPIGSDPELEDFQEPPNAFVRRPDDKDPFEPPAADTSSSQVAGRLPSDFTSDSFRFNTSEPVEFQRPMRRVPVEREEAAPTSEPLPSPALHSGEPAAPEPENPQDSGAFIRRDDAYQPEEPAGAGEPENLYGEQEEQVEDLNHQPAAPQPSAAATGEPELREGAGLSASGRRSETDAEYAGEAAASPHRTDATESIGEKENALEQTHSEVSTPAPLAPDPSEEEEKKLDRPKQFKKRLFVLLDKVGTKIEDRLRTAGNTVSRLAGLTESAASAAIKPAVDAAEVPAAANSDAAEQLGQAPFDGHSGAEFALLAEPEAAGERRLYGEQADSIEPAQEGEVREQPLEQAAVQAESPAASGQARALLGTGIQEASAHPIAPAALAPGVTVNAQGVITSVGTPRERGDKQELGQVTGIRFSPVRGSPLSSIVIEGAKINDYALVSRSPQEYLLTINEAALGNDSLHGALEVPGSAAGFTALNTIQEASSVAVGIRVEPKVKLTAFLVKGRIWIKASR